MAHALCSSTQLLSVIKSVCKGRHSGAGGGGVAAGSVDRKERARVQVSGHGGRGGVRRGAGWSSGAYGPTRRGEGLISTQHMPSLSRAGHLPHIPWLLRRHLQRALNVVRCFFFIFCYPFLFPHFKIKALHLQQLLSVSDVEVTHLA